MYVLGGMTDPITYNDKENTRLLYAPERKFLARKFDKLFCNVMALPRFFFEHIKFYSDYLTSHIEKSYSTLETATKPSPSIRFLR